MIFVALLWYDSRNAFLHFVLHCNRAKHAISKAKLLFCLHVKCRNGLMTAWVFQPLQQEQYSHCVTWLASVDGPYLLLLYRAASWWTMLTTTSKHLDTKQESSYQRTKTGTISILWISINYVITEIIHCLPEGMRWICPSESATLLQQHWCLTLQHKCTFCYCFYQLRITAYQGAKLKRK